MIEILNTIIYENAFILMDIWSILHVLLFYYIAKKYPQHWILVFAGMVAFEVGEALLYGKGVTFLGESFKDTISDIVFNLVGYGLGHII